MPRNVPLSFRQAAEARYSDDVDLAFITISHPLLDPPIRVNWDTKDFIYGGQTYIGFPFDLQLLSDDDDAPKATLRIQNVDQQIGETIRALRTPPRLEITFLHSTDFNLAVDPRTEIGTAGIVWKGKALRLVNIEWDDIEMHGDIVGWDNLQRVWPGIRATQDLLPALFR